MAEAGFPPGVVNLVTGTGGEVGDAIVENPDVAVISFTGIAADRQGDRGAGRRARSSGSRSSSAARTASSSWPTPTSTSPPTGSCGRAFGTTGQRCTACSRVIVERPVVDAAAPAPRVARHARSASATGSTPTTDVGPLINAPAVDKVASYIDIGRARGRARHRVAAARRMATSSNGHFFEPTIFAGVSPMDRIGQEEIFGPVLSVIPVADYGEAMTGAQPDPLRARRRASSRAT